MPVSAEKLGDVSDAGTGVGALNDRTVVTGEQEEGGRRTLGGVLVLLHSLFLNGLTWHIDRFLEVESRALMGIVLGRRCVDCS